MRNIVFLLIGISVAFLLFVFDLSVTKKSNTELNRPPRPANRDGVKNMKLTSSTFTTGQAIPKEFTCEGKNYNPPLDLGDVPQTAKSLALVVEDPDTPMGTTWYHWLILNISPTATGIAQDSKPEGSLEGMGSGNSHGYQGPCPPDPKAHRYIFTLYALDKMMDLPNTTDVPAFRQAIKDHILEEAKLTGLYTGPAKR